VIQCQEYSAERSSQCPEQHGEQTYPHPDYCDQFYLCTNGTLTLEQCGNGLLYDGKGAAYHFCNYHWAVDCGNRKAERRSHAIKIKKKNIYPLKPKAHCTTVYTNTILDGDPWEGDPHGSRTESQKPNTTVQIGVVSHIIVCIYTLFTTARVRISPRLGLNIRRDRRSAKFEKLMSNLRAYEFSHQTLVRCSIVYI